MIPCPIKSVVSQFCQSTCEFESHNFTHTPVYATLHRLTDVSLYIMVVSKVKK